MFLNQRVHAVHIIRGDTYSGCTTQMTFGILVSIRIVTQFRDIFVCHQADQFTVLVNDRQFFYFMGLQGFHDRRIISRTDGDQVLTGHHFAYRTVHVGLETQVTVRHDTYQHMLLVHYRYTADMKIVHQLQCIAYRLMPENGHGVGYHAVLRTLDGTHLSSLLGDSHILMNNPYTAFTSYGNRHRRFRHSIHRCTHQRDIKRYMPRELSGQGHLTGQHFAVRGN